MITRLNRCLNEFNKNKIVELYDTCSFDELTEKLHTDKRTLRRVFKHYNIKRKPKILSEQHKNKLSKSLLGRPSSLKGRTLSLERRQQIASYTSGKNNPFYGKHHSAASKRQMVENHADFNGDKNPLVAYLKNPENQKKYNVLIQSKLDLFHSDKEKHERFKKNLSIALTETYKNHPEFFKSVNHLSGWFNSQKSEKAIYFRSSLELLFLNLLDNHRNIRSVKSCDKVIFYTCSSVIKKYFPDFILNDKIIVEIKPKSLLSDQKNESKIIALKAYCKLNKLKCKIITEEFVFKFYTHKKFYKVKEIILDLLNEQSFTTRIKLNNIPKNWKSSLAHNNSHFTPEEFLKNSVPIDTNTDCKEHLA